MPVLLCDTATDLVTFNNGAYCLSDGVFTGGVYVVGSSVGFQTDTDLNAIFNVVGNADINTSNGFDITTIDPATATALYTAGFLLIITPWAAAWGFSQLLKLTR